MVAGFLSLIPQYDVGTSGFNVEIGGVQFSNAVRAHGEVFAFMGSKHDFDAGKATQRASFDRRAEDWKLQKSQAEKEITRIDKDIIGAKIRLQIAERELDNHDLQVAQAREVDMFMRSKFTNKQLYNWMVGQLSTLYFQTYQLAFDLAKRAERAYRHELFIEGGAPIIKYGYWDSLRKGLLAGEKLGHDLERLELAYMDRDVREFELRKSVSLAALNPTALRDLQETGTCSFKLPEVIFDLDHPGHYLRRIRAMRLTIPAVVGPYTTLGARLKLDDHQTRKSTSVAGGYAEETEPEMSDERFAYGTGSGQSIATSTAMQDGGLFNLDFRDERYLPFEYSGAISSWTLDLPAEVRQFDYRTISDVVVHVDYTAREGGSKLRDEVELELVDQLNAALEGQELMQMIVVNSAFPNEWERFLAEPGASADQDLTLPIKMTHFPYFAQRQGLVVNQLDFALLLSDDVGADGDLVLEPSFSEGSLTLVQQEVESELKPLMVGVVGSLSEQPDTWTLSLEDDGAPAGIKSGTRLDRSKIAGMLMIIRYTLDS